MPGFPGIGASFWVGPPLSAIAASFGGNGASLVPILSLACTFVIVQPTLLTTRLFPSDTILPPVSSAHDGPFGKKSLPMIELRMVRVPNAAERSGDELPVIVTLFSVTVDESVLRPAPAPAVEFSVIVVLVSVPVVETMKMPAPALKLWVSLLAQIVDPVTVIGP